MAGASSRLLKAEQDDFRDAGRERPADTAHRPGSGQSWTAQREPQATPEVAQPPALSPSAGQQRPPGRPRLRDKPDSETPSPAPFPPLALNPLTHG